MTPGESQHQQHHHHAYEPGHGQNLESRATLQHGPAAATPVTAAGPAPQATPPLEDWRARPAYRRAQERVQRELVGILEPLPGEEDDAGSREQEQECVVAEGYYNDDRNAREFVSTCALDVRHCVSTAQWLQWTGLRWERDPEECGMVQRARQFSRDLIAQSAALPPRDGQAQLQRGLALGNLHRIRPLLEFSRRDPRVLVRDTAAWNADPLRLGVANGAVDLRPGAYAAGSAACVAADSPVNASPASRFLPPERDHMITKAAGVAYDASATCPRWEAFLEQILPDAEVRHFLQVSAGYWLTGDTSAQCFWFLYGSGANGKSTFLETLYHLGGDYALRANAMLSLAPNGRDPAHELSQLPGVRLLVGSEVADGMKLNEVLVKDITGGDTLTARVLYRPYFTFRPVAKLVMFGNHRPTISGTDGGMWRRVRLVPFTTVIPPEQRDPHLQRALLAELPGILNWALRGLAHYHRHGLPTPPAVLAATESYREDSDPLGEFLAEHTEKVPDMDARVLLNDLYKRYGQWCEDSGRKYPLSRQALRRRMEERGYGGKQTNQGRVVSGIALAPSGHPFE